ncbi:response regulator [Streptomyces marianii]|uniref:Response regulator transcription factor n=1 Tax=Streptomyces marianii TaxID=1817406 RepID=A0A5R9E189_9ACTN|nr:response regulator transcription factor [Streptomyces marianii]TLQ43167.1 response regulator transcription factor [Streptomyces marianii]
MVIHVLIADDSEIVRRGLSDIVEAGDDLHVVAQAWDGRSAVNATRQFSPDVALLDIRMPGMDGLEATREIRALPRPPRVLILTMFGADEYVDEAVQAGVSGFLLKDTPPEDLLRAVRQVAEGKAALDPAVTGRVLEQLAGQSARLTVGEQQVLDSLTERDLRVLRLIARGLSNADIGTALHISEGTVKGQVSRLLAKLGRTTGCGRPGWRTGRGWSADEGVTRRPGAESGTPGAQAGTGAGGRGRGRGRGRRTDRRRAEVGPGPG